ncbi:MAG TPA: hypothetical protein PLU10_07440 [Chitinophagaceae bacterium]|nr:hypothetical protein [Chitinophagaceae bacterium]
MNILKISGLFCIALLFMSTPIHAAFEMSNSARQISSGIGVGTIIAIVASWSRNKSVLWAIFHAFCGWFYVIYYVFTR